MISLVKLKMLTPLQKFTIVSHKFLGRDSKKFKAGGKH